MNSKHNKQWGPVARVYSLNIEELENCYDLFIRTLFPYFKELVNDRFK